MANVNGTNGNDNLVGTSGSDTISPLLGRDTADGLEGSDTLVVDYSSAPIDPFAGAAPANVPSVVSSNGGSFSGAIRTVDGGNFVNFSGIEHLQVKLDFWHNTFILDGGALTQGASVHLDGGSGTDTLDADLSDLASVNLRVGAGGITASFGTIISFEAFRLNLTEGADTVTTGAGHDFLTGNGGNDVLNSGAGNDVLSGGSGSNILNAGDGDDRIISTGIDTVDGGGGWGADGWTGDYGSSTANLTFVRDGAAGTGTLSNGTTLSGIEGVSLTTGSGDDHLTFTNAAGGIVAAGAGEDTLNITGGNAFSGMLSADGSGAFRGNLGGMLGSFQLSGIEHLSFVSDGGADSITVDGAPLLAGATLSLDAAGGTDGLALDLTAFDSVSFVVAGGIVTTNIPATLSNFEAFQIASGAGNDTITTQDFNDVVQANGGDDVINTAGGNDLLDGGSGADAMTGGIGNDIYVVDESGDAVTENAGEGSDEIRTSLASFSLAALENIENLTGTSAAGQTLTGNAGANVIAGAGGNDVLDGGSGVDSMSGGAGNDIYHVDDHGEGIVEYFSGGIDEVRTGLASYSLPAFLDFENLTGTNAAGQILSGNWLNNVIIGASGADRLEGGTGADQLIGSLGDDTYVFDAVDSFIENAGGGTDTVESAFSYTLGTNFEKLVLTGASAVNATGNGLANSLTGNGGNNLLDGLGGADAMAGGAGHDTYIVNHAGDTVTEGVNGGNDTVQSSVAFTLGDNVEHLTLTGINPISGTGNALNNVINGNSKDNFIDGGLGADFMAGGMGDDDYVVDNASDQVTEIAGPSQGNSDMVLSSISWTLGFEVEWLTLTGTASISGTGNDEDNVIYGNSAANVLDGGLGADLLVGGLGNDTYIVDNANDRLVDNGGVDTARSSVSFTLASTIDNLTLTGTDAVNGTGNGLWNVLIGNSAANTLDGGVGNDILDGGAGADTLIGGAGHDTYHVDQAGDQVIDTGGGNDHVHAGFDYTLGTDLEYLTLTGSAVSGTGNAKNNLIYGNAGNNVIDGLLGADFMVGGMGDDIYYVENGSDSITEHLNQGTDTVMSSVHHALRGNIENLTLIGTNAVSATGNTLDNVVTGNIANNVIDGGLGADTLSGGGGNDSYRYRSTAESVLGGQDMITGFDAGDKVNLSGIDAIAATSANNDAFTFIGSNAFSDTAGELRATESGGVWTIEADVNGDGVADLVIGLTTDGGYLIGAADFVL